ncbi:MAG: ribose-phosphate diphosphokinase [Candidatus Poseidoniaceae archaeon]|nr:ribose-phosphate diphosphokinase [Candidatus Poseidoniaceae archaeon]
MPIVSGSNSRPLADDLAKELGWTHIPLEARRFPDQEGYVRIPTEHIEAVRSEPVVLVSTTYPDNGIIETLLLLEAIRDVRDGNTESLKGGGPQGLESVGSGVFLAIPYFGYSRQDKRFQAGEAVSAKAIGRLFASRCDGITVLDLHAPSALDDIGVPVAFTSCMPEVAEYLQNNVRPDFILSPDKGAIERAGQVAEAIGCSFSYLEKTRIDAHTIVHKAKDLEVDGRIVTIVDDMIATGGTICRASEALLAQGAKEVHAACTHGLFTGGAISRLDQHVSGVHAANSLQNPRAVISGGPALARGIQALLDGSA